MLSKIELIFIYFCLVASSPYAFAQKNGDCSKGLSEIGRQVGGTRWQKQSLIKYFDSGDPNLIGPWTTDMSFSTDTQTIIFRGTGRDNRAFNLVSSKISVFPMGDDLSNGKSLTYLSNDEVLIADNSNIYTWSLKDNSSKKFQSFNLLFNLSETFSTKPSGITNDVVLGPDGIRFLTLDAIGQVAIWDSQKLIPETLLSPEMGFGSFKSAVFDVTGNYVIIGDKQLSKFNIKTQKMEKGFLSGDQILDQTPDQILVRQNPESGTIGILASGFHTPNSFINIVDLNKGKLIRHIDMSGFQWSIGKMLSSDAQGRLLLVGALSQARLLDLKTGVSLEDFSEPLSAVKDEADKHLLSAVTISPSGNQIALGYRQIAIFNRVTF